MKRWSSVAISVAMCLSGTVALAQWNPVKPVKMISPFPPGTSADISLRPILERMQASFGQPVVAEYLPGAASLISHQRLVASETDGHTIGYVGQSFVLNPYVTKVNYTVDDLAPIIELGSIAFALMVRSDFPATDLRGFVAYAKANPGKLNIGSTGSLRFTNAMFGQAYGFTFTDVPYASSNPVNQALLGGELQGYWQVTGAAIALGDRVKILAVSSPSRLRELPNVPALSESLPGFQFTSWLAFLGPKGMPQAAIDRYNAETREAMKRPELRKIWESYGWTITLASPEELRTRIRKESAEFGTVAKTLGVVPQ